MQLMKNWKYTIYVHRIENTNTIIILRVDLVRG
jgi:hypothetical protein